ncbi:MAG: hypothetical protein DI535_10640 [Citrobacter freundii]|nr:MAG: hypothetical protein DI535_10640 [Citrobacter freundii]
MKRLLYLLQAFSFTVFLFSFYLALIEVFGFATPLTKYNHEQEYYDQIEAYDPSLGRLNSIAKLSAYCDSSYYAAFGSWNADSLAEEHYTNIVSTAVRKKFYHGYSFYGFSDNYLALLFEPLFDGHASAIVLPDDIVKHPFAACSQQSIVMMTLLNGKKIDTRKVIFDGGKRFGGHFSLEVFYDKRWHFFDPDKEPDTAILDKLGRPDIESLANNQPTLVAAYRNLPADNVVGLFSSYVYGSPDRAVAPRASIYQQITKILSYTIWIIPLMLFFWVSRRIYAYKPDKKNVWNFRLHFFPFK